MQRSPHKRLFEDQPDEKTAGQNKSRANASKREANKYEELLHIETDPDKRNLLSNVMKKQWLKSDMQAARAMCGIAEANFKSHILKQKSSYVSNGTR